MRVTRSAAIAAALLLQPCPVLGQAQDSGLTSAASGQVAPEPALPPSTLRVLVGERWTEWWNSGTAPARWADSAATLARMTDWRTVADGIEHAELTIGGDGAFRTRLIIVRLDPAVVRLALDTGLTTRLRPAWTVADAPDEALFAVNAGQFVRALPWGWVVLDGKQFLAPGSGPLATAVVIDSAGRVEWRHGATAGRTERIAWAFQSYPTLLRDGEIPPPLRSEGRGVDARHRDARLAIGSVANGRIVVAMTRFDALGPLLGAIPLGLTTPEMAAIMGALGARDAVMLDGGISAQLMLRERNGEVKMWRGLRSVPLALIATARK